VQEDDLKGGRFGDGTPNQIRTAFSRPVIVGLAFIVLGFLFLGTAVLFKIGRDIGEPYSAIGFFASLIVGLGCLLWALARRIADTFRR
jgi:hypothetical protein